MGVMGRSLLMGLLKTIPVNAGGVTATGAAAGPAAEAAGVAEEIGSVTAVPDTTTAAVALRAG